MTSADQQASITTSTCLSSHHQRPLLAASSPFSRRPLAPATRVVIFSFLIRPDHAARGASAAMQPADAACGLSRGGMLPSVGPPMAGSGD